MHSDPPLLESVSSADEPAFVFFCPLHAGGAACGRTIEVGTLCWGTASFDCDAQPETMLATMAAARTLRARMVDLMMPLLATVSGRYSVTL
jgi:hypothetical protein